LLRHISSCADCLDLIAGVLDVLAKLSADEYLARRR
jgi:hypothetical protein